jgi:hypothetical protein
MNSENSIINISHASTELISEEDSEVLLLNYEGQSLKLIELKDYDSALVYLKKSQETIESIIAQGGLIKKEIIISLLQNTAFCYQE